MSKEFNYQLNIQLFAEEGAEVETEVNQNDEVNESSKPAEENKAPEKKYSDEDVNNIIAKQKAKWERDSEEKISEAKKLAKMNAEEKAKYELEKKEADIAKREAEINRRELIAQAKDELVTRDLPIELSEVLNYESADTVQESMASVEKIFRMAVEKAVNDKLRGTPPTKGSTTVQMNAWDSVAQKYKK